MLRYTLFLTVLLFYAGASRAGNYYVFIGSYNWDKDADGIYAYKLDTIKGTLHFVSACKALNPAYLCIAPHGDHIYACTEAKAPMAGSVSSFAFTESHGLQFLNSQKSGGENPVYLNTGSSSKWLINANYTEASVSLYPLRDDGSIAPIEKLITFTGGSIDSSRQEAAHIHAAVFSPTQDHIFFPDLGSDKIYCYKFSPGNIKPLKPAQPPFVTTTPGSGPRHMCFDPRGKFAYCIEELSGTITAYQYSKGKLDSIQRLNAHSNKYTSGFNSADIHISPDGKFLYASNRGIENNIAIFSINNDGTLRAVGYQSTYGDHPRIFDIDPTGKFLIVANQISGDVIVFKREIRTGLLKKTGMATKIKGASCVKIRRYDQ